MELWFEDDISSLGNIWKICLKLANCIREVKIKRSHDQRFMWLYRRKLLIVFSVPATFGHHNHSDSVGKSFLIYYATSRGFIWPRVQRVVWLNGLKFLMVNHHNNTKFSGHRPCYGKNKAAKIHYVNLQGHVIKGLGNFIEGNSSLCVPTLSILVTIDIVVMDISLF